MDIPWFIWALLLILFIIVILGLLLIALTTGFKNTGRLMGGLYCLRSPPSQGKSYVATALAVYFMKLGRKVFSNYPIVYDDGIQHLESLVLEKEMLLEKNLSDSVLIMDEAHRWFWSRRFKEFDDAYKDFFSTLAQHQISCYYVVQHEDRVDTIINDCCNLFGFVEKTEIPYIDVALFFTVTWYNSELDMQLAQTRDNIEPFNEEKFWFNKDIANAYNTRFFGMDNRPPYDGEKWLHYLTRKKMEYKGSYDFSLQSRIKKQFIDIFNNVILYILKLVFKWIDGKIGKRWVRPLIGMTQKRMSDWKKNLIDRLMKMISQVKELLMKIVRR